MSFETVCQVCGAKATIVITSQKDHIVERYCDKHFNESRAGFTPQQETEWKFT